MAEGYTTKKDRIKNYHKLMFEKEVKLRDERYKAENTTSDVDNIKKRILQLELLLKLGRIGNDYFIIEKKKLDEKLDGMMVINDVTKSG